MLDQHFVILGAIIALAGTSKYIVDTLRGETQPNRVTWSLWALAPMIAFAAEIDEGVGLRSLMTFIAGFSPLLVLVASFINKKAAWKLTKFDLTCGALSLIGLVLWLITGQGNLAITLSIIADGLAALPTISKSYTHPESETWVGFLGHGINAAIALMTINVWTFANYAFPLYILIVNIILISLIRFKIGIRLQAHLAQ